MRARELQRPQAKYEYYWWDLQVNRGPGDRWPRSMDSGTSEKLYTPVAGDFLPLRSDDCTCQSLLPSLLIVPQ